MGSSVSALASLPPVTISDLANRVVKKLENRTSAINDAYEWVRDSLVEITSNQRLRDDLDELEIWGAAFVLNTTDTEYAFSNLLPTDVLDPLTGSPLTTVNMATLSVRLWSDPPTNSKWIQLNPTNYQYVDRSGPIQGQPATWYRFGDSIGFDPSPDNTYQVQARILRYHPINDANLSQTVILLNRDWHECIVLGAVERGFIDLQEFDKASAIHSLLHGDPENPAKPGLLYSVKPRRKKEAFRKTTRLKPVKRGYSFGKY